MSSKFGKIKTADELEKAIIAVKAGQKALGTGISKDARHLMDSMKPSNMVNSLVSNFVPATTLSDAGIGLIHGIKKLFTAPDKSGKAKKNLKKAAQEEAVPPEETVETAAEAAEQAAEPEPAAETESETQAD